MLRSFTSLMDLTTRMAPARWRYPADHEASEVGLRNTVMYDAPAREELGVTPRSAAGTVRDTIESMVASGRLPEKFRPR
jgi:hypothetical protein